VQLSVLRQLVRTRELALAERLENEAIAAGVSR
jgi:hypothetical protein